MHKLIYFDQRLVDHEDALVSAISSAALYGKGIFTTIAIHDGEPFLWPKHWQRLVRDADRLNISLEGHSEASTRSGLEEIVKKNRVSKGRARITFFDGSASSVWAFEAKLKTSLLITTADSRPIPEHFSVELSDRPVFSRSSLAGVKSCNYLDNLLALEEAKGQGADEAIRLNERGDVTSACMANVFWLKGDRLFTPSLITGCLQGTTREYLLENLECSQVELGLQVLTEADAIYLTSAGFGAVRVSRFLGRQMKKAAHPITDLLRNDW